MSLEKNMTLPNERRNSIAQTEQFLIDLIDPAKTPRIPKRIRERASACLRHYPTWYHMLEAKKYAPKIFGEWDSEFDNEEHSSHYYDTERNK